jgi:hypothetical protein
MEMTDLQNVFWEARARRERVSEEIALSSRRFHDFEPKSKEVRYRFITLVSETALHVVNLARGMKTGLIAPPRMTAPAARVADYPLWNNHEWTYAAFGAERTDFGRRHHQLTSRWSIDETGIVEVIGSVHVSELAPDSALVVDPYEFAATAAHAMYLATYIHRYSGNLADRWILSGELQSDLEKVYVRDGSPNGHVVVDLRRGVTLRPSAVALEAGTEDSFRFNEDRIWAAFSLPCPDNARHPYERPHRLST